jgi:hypothetical protein
MRKCPHCGLENADDAAQCVTCHTELVDPSSDVQEDLPIKAEMSPEEQRFWEKMTFRQFAILTVRLQALWLFFNAFLNMTYLPRFAAVSNSVSAYATLSPTGRLDLLMVIVRIILNIAAGLAIIQNTEKVLHWLVKDCIQERPAESNSQGDHS